MIALRRLLLPLLVIVLASAAQAQTLKIADRHASKTVTARQLLADPAIRTVTIANDSVYGRSMTYRALPAAELIKGLAIGPDDYVEFTATDRFSIGIPARLLLRSPDTRPQALLAIEAGADPWPAIPNHGKETPGPFFLVWQDARRGEISSEYWVYKLASLEVTDSPYKRWPMLDVAHDLPATHPARRGLDRYVTLCISCHRFNGAGEGEMGPDLAKPMNPVDYFQPDAFRKFLRSAKSVRDWPGRKMPSFVEDVMSNDDMEALIAWLTYKARHP